jgi:non-homologous end joining protein Ku
MSLGKLLVENLTSKGFDISSYHDDYIEKLEDLINAKAKGEVQVVRQAVKKPRETQDLIAALSICLLIDINRLYYYTLMIFKHSEA